ncbi:response regulator [Cohnella cholangitidis]|uniref:Response regulator n=1 Tax=Cohnella cholangitidis TaxID=2598458 RepID=A0A7G5BWJ3_9BACL|nr:response regulator [Cohnella cholangitidis]QMV41327.1 response regulator [Cohnella cholangitidis]
MLTMLVVDDEMYALKGITQGIDWSEMPIGRILEAENVFEAKKHIQENKVDLLISDIEMPGANGLELLRYIREASPQTLTIFLTGHARFEYAQEALHMGCFDYVLKPVDHDVLKEIVGRAIVEIDARKQQAEFESTLDSYRRQWKNQLPILVDRFWQELLAGRVGANADRLNRQFEQLEIPLTVERGRVLPILLSIEQWDVELDSRDESIMEYALRKAAAETILGELPGTVVQEPGELNLALLYLDEADIPDRKQLLHKCGHFVKACNDYFHCRVSCYVDVSVRVGELPAALERLMQIERSNVSSAQTVVDASTSEGGTPGGSLIALPSFLEWTILLDNGQQEELIRLIETTIDQFQAEAVGRETLELFQYGFLHMLYQAAYRKGISIYEAMEMTELLDAQAVRSPQLLKLWAARTIQKCLESFQEKQRDSSAIIAKVQAYIQDNLQKELNRDDIAHSVFRNPAYVSRLFRKETGISLTDYITQTRIERAKKLLAETNDKISNIAEGLSYVHFSYFAKLFKKVTGLSPQEYRKKHQVLR